MLTFEMNICWWIIFLTGSIIMWRSMKNQYNDSMCVYVLFYIYTYIYVSYIIQGWRYQCQQVFPKQIETTCVFNCLVNITKWMYLINFGSLFDMTIDLQFNHKYDHFVHIRKWCWENHYHRLGIIICHIKQWTDTWNVEI